MTTKRLLLAIGAVVGVLGLIVVIFVGGIFGIVWYQLSQSEAAARAKEFLSSNEKLKQDIGEVKSFGRFVSGSINSGLDYGEAKLNFKVEGEHKTVNASVNLILLRGNTWRVTSASYVNSAGQNIILLDPYDSKLLMPLLRA
jgi:hypothetical protein